MSFLKFIYGWLAFDAVKKIFSTKADIKADGDSSFPARSNDSIYYEQNDYFFNDCSGCNDDFDDDFDDDF